MNIFLWCVKNLKSFINKAVFEISGILKSERVINRNNYIGDELKQVEGMYGYDY